MVQDECEELTSPIARKDAAASKECSSTDLGHKRQLGIVKVENGLCPDGNLFFGG
jgi:hypothetical protein